MAAAKSDDIIFTVTVPYARKIEGNRIPGRKRAPQSSQAPEGVFAAVALLAKSRFGNSIAVKFTLSVPTGGGTPLEQWASKTSLTRNRWVAPTMGVDAKGKERLMTVDGKKARKRKTAPYHESRRQQWLRRQPAIMIWFR